MTPSVEPFFDPVTGTISYVVFERRGGHAAVIDPVLDYDPKSGRTRTVVAGRITEFVRAHALTVDWILETHAHADHLSAADYLKGEVGGRTAIGDHIGRVQKVFKRLFNLDDSFAIDGSQFDHLLAEHEKFHIGELQVEVMFVPGHTPADIAYRIGDVVFVGDTLFMPDVGTARCDFPGGDAATLYRSIQTLFALPPQTKLFMCHDYPPTPRAPRWETTVAEQRAHNIHIRDGIDEAAFVSMRTARDKTLDMPVLMLPSIQVNIAAGALPVPETNGKRYLKIPVNAL